MKKRKLFIALMFMCLNGVIKSQDTIYKINGDIIVSKISEISPTEIKYKRSDMPDGPVFIELKSNVVKIKYSNGVIDNFQKAVVATDDYVSSTPQSNKIEFNGRRYMYKEESYNEKGIQNILLETKDKQITDLVRRAKQARSSQFIGFLGIPFGAVATVASYVALISYDSFNNNNEISGTALKVAGISAIVGVACPIAAMSFKAQRKQLNAQAVKLFNEKYQ